MDAGDLVEEFELPDETGRIVRLATLLERGPVVLFFYPLAMTKGCTAESCHFRDLRGEFEALGATPVGISMDTVDKQQAFATRHGFGFPLLSDSTGAVATQFGVRRTIVRLLPVRRATFVIGTDHRVLGVVRSELRMDDHADRALEIVRTATAVPS
jgi:peroxiredoxin Q/BCP